MKFSRTPQPLRSVLLAAVGGALVAGLARGADSPGASQPDAPRIPAEIRARKTIIPDLPGQSVIPKQEEKSKGSESFTPLAPGSSVSGLIDAPLFQPMQRPNNSVFIPLTREKREEMDRKKNWIFVAPDDKAFSAEKILGVRRIDEKDAVGEEKEFKGAMQAFVEKRAGQRDDSEREDGSSTNSSSGGADPRADKGSRADDLGVSSDRLRSATRGAEGGLFGAGENRQGASVIEPAGSMSLFRGSGEYSGGITGYGNSAGSFGGLTGSTSARAEKTDNQKAWASDFKQLLNSSPAGGASRGNDPLSFFNDASRQPLNPVVGSSLGSLPGPGLSRSPFDAPKSAGFDALSRPPAFGEPAPTIFGNSSLSPSLFAPQSSQPTMLPKPGVLEIPKRKL